MIIPWFIITEISRSKPGKKVSSITGKFSLSLTYICGIINWQVKISLLRKYAVIFSCIVVL